MSGPKTSLEEINAAIKKEQYILLPDGRTTICILTLDNGFTVRGESSCVVKSNYKKDAGEIYAREHAIEKCWVLFGFRLADRLYQARLRRGKGVKFRDAASGMYVTPAYAKLNPKTTLKESSRD